MDTSTSDQDEVDSFNEVSPEEEASFLKDILGPHAEAATKLNRTTEIDVEWDGRSNNPQNHPLHEAVTEQFFLPGGKEVKAVHDKVGTFYHIEYSPGGPVPKELSGSYTDESSCRLAIRIYVAKKHQELE